ncbi:FAD-dependent oxidoreductase [Rhodanobacter sp. PCA2]|uniref:NAD(P)/FAD-dependent oxidoreductase n=1 Tax=Rhodanobacter sp. PCA2 TaxID=2006117 RepID=UPI0015E7B89F|nr:FAD-dependent oxidoreductase [Rhodanobacter sp. PCA2]MBA2077397.1 pyridine nucleotide-disulfide oxidoreductase [Rhodanobacter sp. PCA2]
MANIVILGAGLGGTAAAYEIKAALGAAHTVTLVGDGPYFQFTPSNPWVAVGWRKPEAIRVEVEAPMRRHGIRFIPVPAQRVLPAENRLHLADGQVLDYDYLVITTGPRLAFDDVPGLGPEGGHTHSICTGAHAEKTWQAYQALLERPGPVLIGAAPGASCFGPAYEFAMIVDADLRRRKLRDRVPITYVTPEPYVGHMGLGGVGDSRGLMESALRERDIRWVTNARVTAVEAGNVKLDELDERGALVQSRELPHAFAMLLPAFAGIAAVRGIEGLTNPRGFILIDEHQRNPAYRNIFSAGVCVAIPPVEVTPVPTGAPKTGFMIESMVGAIASNLRDELAGKPAQARATWNAVCLADMGDTGAAFVALPQIPPRNVTWARIGKWVHVAKLAFERYHLRKVRTGNTHPIYERAMLKLLRIGSLKQ